MNRITDYIELRDRIVGFLNQYRRDSGMDSFVVGVSGGIDSSLHLHWRLLLVLLSSTGDVRSIRNRNKRTYRTNIYIGYKMNFPNVTVLKYNLSDVFETFKTTLGEESVGDLHWQTHSFTSPYGHSVSGIGLHRGLVVGTGNKVEDYGVGFYTKYGDGGVDIAPIVDLYKSEVWQLGVELGVNPRIVSKHLLLMDFGMMVEPMKINWVPHMRIWNG